MTRPPDLRDRVPLVVSKSDDGEAYIRFYRGEDYIDLYVDQDDQRLVWIGKFDGKYARGGDEPWPDGLAKMFGRLKP